MNKFIKVYPVYWDANKATFIKSSTHKLVSMNHIVSIELKGGGTYDRASGDVGHRVYNLYTIIDHTAHPIVACGLDLDAVYDCENKKKIPFWDHEYE
jgi:hypothetical protein